MHFAANHVTRPYRW